MGVNGRAVLLLLAVLCVFTCGSSAEETNDHFLLGWIWKCSKSEDLGNCLKMKAALYIDELVRAKEPLVINDYLSLAKDPKSPEPGPQALNETEYGRSDEGKGEYLDRLIWEKLIMLFTTRTIQLNLSSGLSEGRGKEDKMFKKGHGFLLMAGMMGGMMMKMALGKIALIAGKALILGKIALVLSLLLVLRRFATRVQPPEVVFTSADAGGRKFGATSFWRSEDGGDLAYNAHKPESLNKI